MLEDATLFRERTTPTMRALVTALMLGLVLAAAPAAAQDPVSEPCDADAVAAADYVLTADGLSETVGTPLLPSPYPLGLGGEPDPAGFQDAATEVHSVIFDVNPDHLSGVVGVGIDWEHTGDIDMDVYVNGQYIDGSHNFNPVAGNGEFVSVGRVNHCKTIDVHIRNYIATQGDIQLTLKASALRDL